MKKVFFAGFLVSTLIFSACSSGTEAPADASKSSATRDENRVGVVSNATVKATPKLTPADYSQWKLPKEVIDANFGPNEWSKRDCIGLYNGYTGPIGGDLLSTLIADNDARALMDLKVYSPEYVMTLENKVVAYTHAKYASDFYASHVCHLRDGVDIFGGVLWPRGVVRDDYPAEFFGKMNRWEGTDKKGIFVLVNNGRVFGYENIRRFDQSVTGAEVSPCSSKLNGDMLVWSCAVEYKFDSEEIISDQWLIPLDGGAFGVQRGISTKFGM